MTTYNFIDRTGQVFGRLTVTKRADNRKGRTMWECLCDCGNKTIVRGEHLKNNVTQSCGCYSVDSHAKHNMSRTVEYHTWTQVKQRCTNENDPSFFNYGARGITICDRWLNSFENFIEDMGEKPDPALTIERIDNEKGYSPDNCKWATRKEQVRNRRNSINHTIDGKTQCLKDWCIEYHLSYNTVRHRIMKGKSINEALGVIV